MATKLKGDDLGKFDIDELDVEWSDSDYGDYEGEQPPTGTVLRGGIKKMWWTFTSNEDPMIKALWVADGNTGKLAEYNGLTVWDNIVFTPKAAFRYGPFLQVLGLTLKQVKTMLYVADEDDNIGAPIERIAKVAPGTESTECGVVTKRRKYNGEWSVNIAKYIEQPDADDDDDDDDEEEAPRQTRGSRKAADKPASKPAAKRRSRPEPEPAEDEDEDDIDEDDVDDDDEDAEDEDEPEEKPARRKPAARTASKPAARKPAAKASSKPAARSRRKADDDDEEPF